MRSKGAFVVDRRSNVHFLPVFLPQPFKFFDQFGALGGNIAFFSGIELQVKNQKFDPRGILQIRRLRISVVRDFKDRLVTAGP